MSVIRSMIHHYIKTIHAMYIAIQKHVIIEPLIEKAFYLTKSNSSCSTMPCVIPTSSVFFRSSAKIN